MPVKKTTTKNALLKSVEKKSAKKAVTKKVVSASKRNVSSKVTEQEKKNFVGSSKSVQKKATEKSSRRSTSDRSEDTKKDNSEKNVLVPTNMSLRAVEKSAVIKNELINNLQGPMFRIAYVAGVCMILIGLSYVASGNITQNSNQWLLAETYSTTGGTSSSTGAVIETKITQLTDIPDRVTNKLPVDFLITNTNHVQARLRPAGGASGTDINISKVSGDTYRLVIPGDKDTIGYYSIRIEAIPLNANLAKVFETKVFKAGREPVEVTQDPIIQELPLTEVAPATEPVETQEPNTTTTQTTNSVTEIRIYPPSSTVLTGTRTLKVLVPNGYLNPQLFIRPSKLINAFRKQSDRWEFTFDTNKISNGPHEFYIQAEFNGANVESKSITLTVNNEVANVSTQDPNTVVITAPKTTETSDPIKTPTSAYEVPVQPLVKIEPIKSPEPAPRPTTELREKEYVPTLSLETSVRKATLELLEENRASFDDLFRKYAIAQQSGDQEQINSAREAIQKKKDDLALSTISSDKHRYISDDIDKELQAKIENLQKKVDIFEKIKKDKKDVVTGVEIDTDEDGVSDYDEINIYGSDPNIADTDNDGVPDGEEIIKGHNLLSAESEAMIEYQSPKESFGLVREDVIRVGKVGPVTKISPEPEEDSFLTEIAGRALPNSFITLFIYSSPTVVTIKTDADGDFVYTFDKELEDGRHDVYAAITDNDGEIIAQSNPFSFIKEAQAFTPVDASNSEITLTGSPEVISNEPYKVVAGLGILALGLILIMLGITLRTKKEDGNDGPSADEDDSKEKPTFISQNKFDHIEVP